MIDLTNFYSGGYFLIRAHHPEWPQFNYELLPAAPISLSVRVCPRVRVHWGWIPGDREGARVFGIPETKLDECLEWCAREYDTDMDMWSMFYSPAAARRFIRRFDLPTENLYLIGAGLPIHLEAQDWRAFYDEKEDYGIEKRIHQQLPIEEGGQSIGFEVVSFEGGDLSNSWLCSGLEKDMHDLFGIRPNAFGLIDTLEDAIKVYTWIKEDEMKGTRAEPEPYDVWLLLNYPLEC